MKTKVLFGVFLGVLCCAVMADQKTKVSIRPTTNESLPTMVSWGYWTAQEYEPGGYQKFLDMVSVHSPYTLLMCAPQGLDLDAEVTDEHVHDQVKEAAAYGRKLGILLTPALDPRCARDAFRKAYPDELQEILRLRQVDLKDDGEIILRVPGFSGSDQFGDVVPIAGRLVRVYSYVGGPEGVEPGTLQDITNKYCKLRIASPTEVSIAISCSEQTKGLKACAVACFTLTVPDVFAPHLLTFVRKMIQQYADTDIGGVCLDEWGFPPCYDGCPDKNDFWYSRFCAAAYAELTGGRDLVRDCLLMYVGERGSERERQMVINQFMRMSLKRNAAIEDAYYRMTKTILGQSALMVPHATWWPYPGTREFMKNGLDWWQATRDIAQTDEVVPYCVRTSLTKKWGSAVWYNMYFNPSLLTHQHNMWRYALTGGRITFHPLGLGDGWGHEELLKGGLMRGYCRIRLVDFITKSPLDCPVAVIFGHAGAMNWAGPSYDDVGMAVADGLWRAGFPSDLIPTSEIGSKALRIDKDGYVYYGPQRYAVVVLYHPEFEGRKTASFFQKAAKGKTLLYRVGDWTRDFNAKVFDGNAALPEKMMTLADPAGCVSKVVGRLTELGFVRQTPATEMMIDYHRQSSCPPAKGRYRLIDGTEIIVSGEKEAAGDQIQTTFEIKGQKVEVSAVGIVAVRLADDRTLQALAAGGLKYFKAGPLKIALEEPVDVALWHDERGKMQGVLQDYDGPVPPALAGITKNWIRLAVPVPLPDKHQNP